MYGLIQSQSDGWGSTTVIAALAASAALLAVFIAVERIQAEPMLDLGLLRVPTFVGGLVAAWAVSAALLSMLTYLIIYMQNSLGLSAVDTGIRFLPLTVAIFITAGIAGRLTSRVPRRALISAGFVLTGAGLMLMRGLEPSSDWTHLLPGMIVGGIGTGLVSTPLISTAVGVVEPARAGMASGINSTLRQVGIATGVAGLGTILSSQVRTSVVDTLNGGPLAAHAHGTRPHDLVRRHPAGDRVDARSAARPRRDDGPLGARRRPEHDPPVAACVAFVAAVVSFVLIRERDFVMAEVDEAPAELAVAA